MPRSFTQLVAGVFSVGPLRWSEMTISNILLLTCLNIDLICGLHFISSAAQLLHQKYDHFQKEQRIYLTGSLILFTAFELIRLRLGFFGNNNQFPELCAFLRLTLLLLVPVVLLALGNKEITFLDDLPSSPVSVALLLSAESVLAHLLVRKVRKPFHIAVEIWKISID